MTVVDASVWVSVFLPGDSFHNQSFAWSERVLREDRPLFEPTILLPEVVAAINRRGAGSAITSRFISHMTGDPLTTTIPVDEELAVASAHVAVETGLRGADAIYVCLALHLGASLVTWDNEQLERGGQVVHALTPERALKELL